MSYSNKLYPNKEFEFPAPPLWLIWIEAYQEKDRPDGTLRHYATLDKARKYVSGYTESVWVPKPDAANQWEGRWVSQGIWNCSWAIYEWVDGKWVERHSAKRGESKKDHPLFKKGAVKAEPILGRPPADDEVDAAIASILRAAQ